MVDLAGQTCTKCENGTYGETSIHDDWDGVLHCSNCNHEVKRYPRKMTELSPAAQAVLDAAMNTPKHWSYEQDICILGAALHAAADQLREAYANEEYVDNVDDWLDDIAAELEGTNG